MRTLNVVALLLLAIALGSMTLLVGQRSSDDWTHWPGSHSNEFGLRVLMVHTVMPEYPEEALSAGAQGLVVAAVRSNPNGDLVTIKILQSPDPSISKAVVNALKQWKMKRTVNGGGEPSRYQGELRFHYIIENGVGRVENPTREEQVTYSQAYSDFIRSSASNH